MYHLTVLIVGTLEKPGTFEVITSSPNDQQQTA